MHKWRHAYRRERETTLEPRIRVLQIVFLIAAILLLGRLFRVQIVDHGFYEALASGQHDIYRQLFPERGDILVTDREGEHYTIATNEERVLVAVDLRKMTNPTRAAKVLAETLELDELELKTLLASGTDDPYEPIAHRVPREQSEQIKAANLDGIMLLPEDTRIYPEPAMGGHVLGFFGSDAEGNLSGKYGLEGQYDEDLAGTQGHLEGERDPAGRIISVAGHSLERATDGMDLVLTIDRNIQAFVCQSLKEAVERHSADGGSVIAVNPKTGAVLAMCGAPDFDPNTYSAVEDISVYNNPATFLAYEPGSIFKAITMAGALEEGLDPSTTYEDKGFVKVGVHTIRNANRKGHGIQNMSGILEESLNTGAVFVVRYLGPSNFRKYVERFGFGRATDIDLQRESIGNITSLRERGEIYSATGSFGQGITVTPIQMVAAFAAIANDGKLMRPYVVSEFIGPDDDVIPRVSEAVRQVISSHTATVVSAMLVNVVERGHGKRAGVPGYYIGGKTGTAQVPKKDGRGYEPGLTIGSFAGFGPVDEPVFAMLVRVDHPRDVMWAESSAAPLFGKIAQFILQYYQIPPTR